MTTTIFLFLGIMMMLVFLGVHVAIALGIASARLPGRLVGSTHRNLFVRPQVPCRLYPGPSTPHVADCLGSDATESRQHAAVHDIVPILTLDLARTQLVHSHDIVYRQLLPF